MSTSQSPRLLRLHQILGPDGPIPVSRSTWFEGVRTGRFPQRAVGLGGRIAAWHSQDIDRLAQSPAYSSKTEGGKK